MNGISHKARLLGLAVTRPVEFYDRMAGRRERARQEEPVPLDAEVSDATAVAHRVANVDGFGATGCCSDLPATRERILSRLTGQHHHDGGTSLAEMLWVLVRHRRPAAVVETGVARGVSSAFILDALHRNDHGRLWSIDLPPMTPGWGDQTGIAVAPEVRDRWTYVRGAARRRLDKVLREASPVNLFVHDGLHTTENVLFELRTVWPALASDGVVVADDADHNRAVSTFADEVGVTPTLVREPGKKNVVAVFSPQAA